MVLTQQSGTGTGTLEWNLPAEQSYEAGTALDLQLKVTNPTNADRQYQLYAALFNPDTQELIAGPELVPVGDQQSFTVPAGSYIQMDGQVSLKQTDVIFAMLLLDVALQDWASGVSTLLKGSGSDSGSGTDLFGQIMPIMGLGLVFGMMGSIMPASGKMFGKDKDAAGD